MIMRRFHVVARTCVLLALAASHAVLAADAVLESSALRLEVTAAPYSYSVIEKATGAVLLTESQTAFTRGAASIVTGASITAQTPATVDATLLLAGTSDTAH